MGFKFQMPTYHYRCSECGHAFDQFQRFSEDPLTVCPECEGLIKRVLQPVGIVFKGSGWYVNDSRSDSGSKAAKPSAEKSGDSNGAAKPETKSETKEPKTAEPAKAAAASEH